MAQYRADFLSHTAEIVGSEGFHAKDNEAAIRYASTVLRSPWGKGHEIWDGDRLVHRELYGSGPIANQGLPTYRL